MTQEQKAKAYDKALERARMYWENDNDNTLDIKARGTMEHLFPELRESEDERIRNIIIRCLKGNMPDNDYRKECITWLEKQGEKTKPIEGFDTEFERQISHLIASAIDREHEYNEGYVKWTANALLEYAKREFEKQWEQKPVDIDIDKMVDDYANNKERGNEEFGKPVNCMIRAYRQGLNDAIGKVIWNYAWSEEDEERLQSCLNILQVQAKGFMGITETINTKWLKSLKQRIGG